MGGLRCALAGLLLVGIAGCFEPSAEARARLAEIEDEGRQTDVALDVMEEQLLGNQAMLQTWAELGRRHKQVTAVTCINQDAHLADIARNLEYQTEKARRLRRMRGENGRVAQVQPRGVITPVFTSAHLSRDANGGSRN